MNTKRFIIAGIAVFVVWQVLDFIVNYFILMSTYESLRAVWRPDMMSIMWIMYPVSLFTAFLFVYIFIKGYEDKGIMEGVRFGIIMGLFVNVMGATMQYVVYPLPLSLPLQWGIYGLIEYVIAGILASVIYKTG